MAYFPTLRALIDDNIYDNIIEAITGAIHNNVLNEVIDAIGTPQVYSFPAVTDDPGSPEEPRAYIALPGVYTNFGGVEVTAPLGVIAWNGTAWSVTQITLPSAYEYRRCKTTAALTAGTPYTSVACAMSSGGWVAKAGQWVQLVNRRTGDYDFVQLAADITASSTSITFPSYVIQKNFAVGSSIELDSAVNMKWYGIELTGDGSNNYVTVPSSWRLPPLLAVDANVWYDLMQVVINGQTARWVPTPVGPFDFNVVNDATRLKIYFANNLTIYDKVIVRVYQPRILAITA